MSALDIAGAIGWSLAWLLLFIGGVFVWKNDPHDEGPALAFFVFGASLIPGMLAIYCVARLLGAHA